MRNIKLTIRFVGTNYHGWQIQDNGISVQEVITKALSGICNEPELSVFGCGRTDSGVHALNYVVSFKTESLIPAEKIPLALNSVLPDDISCFCAEEVPLSFNAVRSSVSKTYTYRIYNSRISDPFVFPFVHQMKKELDVDRMREAAAHFIGTHDFAGFAAAGYSVKTTIRTIFDLVVSKENNIISISVTGDGFLYNMVRIIAGTLIEVGTGKIEPDKIPWIIESKTRNNAGPTAPAKGLCLTEVKY